MKNSKLPEEPFEEFVGELFVSPDGDRMFVFDGNLMNLSWTEFQEEDVCLGPGDLEFLFYNWIRVGSL